MTTLKQRVLSGLGWSAAMRLLGQVATWSVTIIVIRVLAPADYGLMGLATVFISFFMMINGLGLGSAIVQRRNLDDDDLRSIFGLVLMISLAICLSLWVAAPFIAEFYSEPKLTLMIRLLSLTFLLSSFNTVPYSILARDMKYRKIAIIDFFAAISGSVITLAFALNGMGVWSLIAGYLIIRIVWMVSLQMMQPFLRTPSFKMKGMGSVFVYGSRVTITEILWFLYSGAAAPLIIGKVLGKHLLGVYEVGLFLACLPMEKVSGIINQVAFPAFSSVQLDPQLAGAHFLKAVRVLSFFSFPLFWGISSVANEIIAIFLGAKWNEAYLPLQIIALAVPIRMVRNLMMPATQGLGRSDVSLSIETVAVVCMISSFIVGSFYGLAGVSLVWILIFPLVFLLNLTKVVTIFGIDSKKVLWAMKKSAFSSAVMYACVQAVKAYLPETISLVPRMTLLVACGIAVYSCMVLLINQDAVKEIRQLIRFDQ